MLRYDRFQEKVLLSPAQSGDYVRRLYHLGLAGEYPAGEEVVDLRVGVGAAVFHYEEVEVQVRRVANGRKHHPAGGVAQDDQVADVVGP